MTTLMVAGSRPSFVPRYEARAAAAEYQRLMSEATQQATIQKETVRCETDTVHPYCLGLVYIFGVLQIILQTGAVVVGRHPACQHPTRATRVHALRFIVARWLPQADGNTFM